jgi:UrcA family protein
VGEEAFDDSMTADTGETATTAAEDEAIEQAANADDESMDDTAYADDENIDVAQADDGDVVVSAPRLRVERGHTLRPGRYKMTEAVSYSDLDLRTAAGAGELRERVRTSASQICSELVQFYPADAGDYGSCYREAARNALVRADAVITDARSVAYR